MPPANWPEMYIQVEKAEISKLSEADKQSINIINDFFNKSNKDDKIKAALESTATDRKDKAAELWIDENILNAYDNLKSSLGGKINILALTQSQQKEMLRADYEKKVFEVGQLYKKNMEAIKKETDIGKLQKLHNDIKQNINDYRVIYTTYEKSINNENAINNVSTQQKEQMLVTAYRYTPQYKELVEKTLETKTYTIAWTPWQDITTNATLFENEQTNLDLGKTNFSNEQIADIATILNRIGNNNNMFIEVTGLTDATPYESPESKKKNEDAYSAIRMKYPEFENISPTIEDIKNDPNVTDEQNTILGYRRVLISMDNAIHNGTIHQADISKFRFSSEVGTHVKWPTERWVRIALKEEITEKIPPTPGKTREITTWSPEEIKQQHSYVQVFAFNPNYGKPENQQDPKYPKPFGRAYMYIQLSEGAARPKEGIAWKSAGTNEINRFNNLEKNNINANDLQSKNINKNVQPIYSFAGSSEELEYINNNFVNNKDYNSSTNELIKPFIVNNKERIENSREEMINNTDIVRYIWPKEWETPKNSEIWWEDIDFKKNDILKITSDIWWYEALNDLMKDRYFVNENKSEDDINTMFTNLSQLVHPEFRRKTEELENPQKENNKKSYLRSLSQHISMYETTKTQNNRRSKPREIADSRLNKEEWATVRALTGENIIGKVGKPMTVNKNFLKYIKENQVQTT